MRRFVLLMISVLLISNTAYAAKEPESALAISAESGVIMEMSSGKVLYEKNGNVELPPSQCDESYDAFIDF